MAEALGVSSSAIAVDDLPAKVLSLCLQYSQEAKHAYDDVNRLSREVAAFQATIGELAVLVRGSHGEELSAWQQVKLVKEDAYSKLGELAQRMEFSTGRKTMSHLGARPLDWPFESKEVEENIQNLKLCRDNISVALNIDQTTILQSVDHRMALDMLPIIRGTSFGSYAEGHSPTCLPNTCEELLEEIDRWILNPNSESMYWLNGMTGTGKSTISRTVARWRAKQGDLGASFFFNKEETARVDLAKFVPTMAYQLAWNIPGVAPFIRHAVDADPEIFGKDVREQFEKLIQEPLSKVAPAPLPQSPVVIVIDGLDECESDAYIKLFLELFSNTLFAGYSRIRVLITSGSELPARLGLSSIDDVHRDFTLHSIPRSIVEHDISIFLHHKFAKIRSSFNDRVEEELKLPMLWPGESNLEKLTTAATPLFISAATLCRFVSDSNLGTPDELLQSVFLFTGNDLTSKLDMAYLPVLNQQVINKSGCNRSDIVDSFRLIVGTIITLASPLSIRALALLLDIDVNQVTTRLRALHSALEVPESLNSPVRLLHRSFRDYLVDPGNRHTVDFWVDEKLAHRNLAKHCLRVMRNTLRENICDLPLPSIRQTTVGFRLLEERISPELRYACIYWIYHQNEIDLEPDDSREVYDFLTAHFLHWVEVLSLLDRSKECLNSLESMARRLENQEHSNLSAFVADAIQILQANLPVITEAPLQIYSSALAFAPRKSVVRKTFENVVPKWLNTLPKVQEGWDASSSTLEGHSDWVYTVAFSHDSTRVASGGDWAVRIWNTDTGDCEQVLEGHGDVVWSVVFSHDSRRVASASLDGTIRIWNAETGDCERVLEGHSDWVASAAFSHDSKKVASASGDKTVRIWNVETGDCERVLEGHSRSVLSVVFSHDSKKLASSSTDSTIRTWNAETGTCKDVVYFDNYTNVVAFTPDERSIVTNRGIFALTGGWESHVKPLEFPTLACQDGTWVTTAGTDLLWLPLECRDARVAISGSTVVVGCHSGRVVILRFSATELAKLVQS